MAAHVLDASLVVALFVEEKDTARAEKAVGKAIGDGAELHAPDLIAYEVANALAKRVRRGDIETDLANERMSDLTGLEITLHPPEPTARVALGLALAHDVSAYDASYLAVALALAAPLLTLDRELRDSCLAAGVSAPRL